MLGYLIDGCLTVEGRDASATLLHARYWACVVSIAHAVPCIQRDVDVKRHLHEPGTIHLTLLLFAIVFL